MPQQATAAPHKNRSDHPARSDLRVSAYDRVASMLIALLIVVGFFVLLLFLIWVTNNVLIGPHVVPVELLEPGGAEGRLGTEKGFEEPDVQQVEDILEPEFEDTVDAISETVSTRLAHLETLQYGAQGAGAGGNLDRGPGGEGNADVIPRWERWETRYESSSLEAYTQQLDFFGIELAATGGGKPLIEYASNLSQSQPSRRTGQPGKEDRLYMLWRSGPLQRADRELLTAAGIDVRGRILVQFYPRPVEQMLAQLERAHTPNREVTEIRKTVFGVRPSGQKYEFYVIDQEFRWTKSK